MSVDGAAQTPQERVRESNVIKPERKAAGEGVSNRSDGEKGLDNKRRSPARESPKKILTVLGQAESSPEGVAGKQKRARKLSARAKESNDFKSERKLFLRSSARSEVPESSQDESDLEYPATIRLSHDRLDKAPWRDPSLPSEKLRAYRDASGRFRVMDMKGKLLKSIRLNHYREEDSSHSGSPSGIRTSSEGRQTGEGINHASDITSTFESSKKIGKTEAGASPPKKRREMKGRTADSPSPSKNTLLFKSIFERPRPAGKREPKVNKSKALKLINSLTKDSSSSDSDYEAERLSENSQELSPASSAKDFEVAA
eukprot:CAMPEP_0184753452 /NCGR_PEP_ID=MMETSP0315-20130426/44109_1 /TAXON_ID=101924 /ORGANISM="Rhodosorus marinus, Strain UTEX LB 2760" /LENGTH=313 /DNA_ID=CAMNT_0027232829 /DNA_START=193 /DNA_END=1134 /DNA_ORIENTATION=-